MDHDIKRFALGVLAHVDSGKTTLSEALLYQTGNIRKWGRVDHGDAFLDTDQMEKKRGITIFSKQAIIKTEQAEIYLLDTPGHVDFSAEMERVLTALDYAVLVVSGSEGVQAHTQTLWKLLEHYGVPVFLFVNKMDLDAANKETVLAQIKKSLSPHCIDFSGEIDMEEVAVYDELLMDAYLQKGEIEGSQIATAVLRRSIFPCYFGSALKLEGVQQLIDALQSYTLPRGEVDKNFAGRVIKIFRDAQNSRITLLKVNSGCLHVRDILKTGDTEEKVGQIRFYSGAKYETADSAPAGSVCAVLGPEKTFAGQGFGEKADTPQLVLVPVLSYRAILPEELDPVKALTYFMQLQEEDPALQVEWIEEKQQIFVHLMGEIQLQIIKSMLLERTGQNFDFDAGEILYRETIENTVEGVGHFEPLRHYAEVHLLLEPGDPGSGMQFASDCREDVLDKNWQRLIMTHLKEKVHKGVLIGAPVTDIKITLKSGRAHIKHTEGGDFREATYRAVRQGLRSAKSVLLEPVYAYTLQVPSDMIGRAIADIQKMHGSFEDPVIEEQIAYLQGSVPVSTSRDYQLQVGAYTHGLGKWNCVLKGYESCHNPEEVIAGARYDVDADIANTADSVFCSHGTSDIVKWNKVPERMHLESIIPKRQVHTAAPVVTQRRKDNFAARLVDDNELKMIFERTYGPIKRRPTAAMKTQEELQPKEKRSPKVQPIQERYLLVDGYNVIFAWEDLGRLAAENLDSARQQLMDRLCNYQGFCGCKVILVFDAYKVKGNPGSVEPYHNIVVVYTKEAQTADAYIEKATHDLSKKYQVRVVSSDQLEQLIILGHGAQRTAVREFLQEMEQVEAAIREMLQ